MQVSARLSLDISRFIYSLNIDVCLELQRNQFIEMSAIHFIRNFQGVQIVILVTVQVHQLL